MAVQQVLDVTTLKNGDLVYYYVPVLVDNTLTGAIEVGIVQGDNIYTNGVDVHGDGWQQYVGKWFICKVERAGEVIYEQEETS